VDIVELLGMADHIMSYNAEDDAQISLVEAYTEAFDQWYTSNRTALKDHSHAFSRLQLEELEKKHALIVKRIELLMKRTSKKMGAFHKKAKGILAYVDVFPKRVSRSKGRKG
jgi:hypothetical protein